MGVWPRILHFHQFNAALFFVFFGVFFDFLMVFRSFIESGSALGIQLDSMADLITSGIAPGVLMYQLFAIGCETIGLHHQFDS